MVVTSDVGGGGAPPPWYITERGGGTVLVAASRTKSLHKMTVRQMTVLSLCMVLLLAVTVDSRYLPTRGQEDRLDRLRDLLRDLLEADADREPVSNMVPDRRPYPKRDMYGYDPAHHFTMDHLLHP